MRSRKGPKVSILVLDDDEVSRSTISRLIRFKLPNVVVYSSDTCRDGFKSCLDHKIDVIITSINNKRVDYARMLDRVRKVNRHAKLLLITTGGESKPATSLVTRADVSLLQMPIDLHELMQHALSSVEKVEEERNQER